MITLAEAKDALGIVGDAEDAAVQRMIDRATATLGRELLRYLGLPASRTEIKDVRGSGWFVVLDEEPAAMPALAMATRKDAFDAWVTTDPAKYRVDGQRVYHRTWWPAGRGTVRAIYTAGFAAGAGPQELQDL